MELSEITLTLLTELLSLIKVSLLTKLGTGYWGLGNGEWEETRDFF